MPPKRRPADHASHGGDEKGSIKPSDLDRRIEELTSERDALARENADLRRLVTDNEQAERSLKESEEKHRSLVEQSLQSMLIIQDGRIVFVNPWTVKLGRYSEEELLKMSPEEVLQLFHPEDRPMIARRMRERLEGLDVPPRYEVRLMRRDGEVLWGDVFVSLVQYRDRVAHQITFIDITERKRIEEALRESEEKYRTLIEMSPDAIIIHRQGRVIYANPPAAYMLGASVPEDLIGKALLDLLHPDFHTIVQHNIQDDLKEKETPPTEVEMIRLDGTMVTVEGKGKRIYIEGKPAILVVLRDSTERKIAEVRLKEYTENLKRSNEDLELFAQIATHDLQEPIRGIVTFSQILIDQCNRGTSPLTEKYLRNIESAGLRMHRLVNDIRRYSGVRAYEKPLRPTDTETALSSALSNLQLVMQEAQASITHDPLPTVMADDTQIIQVFQNLVDNAVKFRKNRASPIIHISVSPQDCMWRFAIQDNGIGIQSEYYDRIFILFERLHRRDAYPGTGLGLALVKRIVQRHGGRIWVESEPGEGSTFYFTLPAVRPSPN